MRSSEPRTGLVLEIQRMSTEDGPGIRTTVFFKGCTLKCAWCHNPESISLRPQVQWIGSRCIGCQTCVETCPNGALTMTPEGVLIDRAACQACGACAEACPSTAMELLGRAWSVQDLADEVAKDRVYFEKSGGGVTASGGEATMQADFVAAFFKACRQRGLATALDTCGQCSKKDLQKILPHADMVLFDIKEIDPERHKAFTGRSNEKILENLILVRDWMAARPRPRELWVRTPIIPEATAADDNIKGIGRFIARNLEGAVSRWELCSFNNLCRDKYIRLGLSWTFKDSDLVTREMMEHLAEIARTSGVLPEIVHWSGATRLDQDEQPPEEESPRLRLVKGGCKV